MMDLWKQVLSEVRELARAFKGKERLAQRAGLSRNHIYDFINEESMLGADRFLRLCEALGLDLTALIEVPVYQDAEPDLSLETLFSVPILGSVYAGHPTTPGESVEVDGEQDWVPFLADSWNSLYPGVDPKGVVGLKISGSSMEPRHRDGDLVFVRPCQDTSMVHDGQTVVIQLPGQGYTCKLWRDTKVLEGINPAFKPIPCPRGAQLWGIVVAGTRVE